LTWAASRLSHAPAVRRLAMKLFAAQQGVVIYRTAMGAVNSWSALKREFNAALPVLMYHNVGHWRRGLDPHLTVSPKLFERHLKWLSRKGYRTIRASDWIAYRRSGTPLPQKPVMLTFDDAFAETAENAFPLLQKYQFCGTVFVVTSTIGGANTWDLPLGVSMQ